MSVSSHTTSGSSHPALARHTSFLASTALMAERSRHELSSAAQRAATSKAQLEFVSGKLQHNQASSLAIALAGLVHHETPDGTALSKEEHEAALRQQAERAAAAAVAAEAEQLRRDRAEAQRTDYVQLELLREAWASGDVEAAERLVGECRTVTAVVASCGPGLRAINELDAAGSSPLHRAAERTSAANVERAKVLLQLGADPAVADAQGATALHRAAYGGALAQMRMLHDAGADVDVLSASGRAPLHYAVHGHRDAAVALLLELGAKPNAQEAPSGSTPLHRAVELQDERCVGVLLSFGRDKVVASAAEARRLILVKVAELRERAQARLGELSALEVTRDAGKHAADEAAAQLSQLEQQLAAAQKELDGVLDAHGEQQKLVAASQRALTQAVRERNDAYAAAAETGVKVAKEEAAKAKEAALEAATALMEKSSRYASKFRRARDAMASTCTALKTAKQSAWSVLTDAQGTVDGAQATADEASAALSTAQQGLRAAEAALSEKKVGQLMGGIGKARRVLKSGADTEAKGNVLRLTPLFVAVAASNVRLTKLLIAHGADANSRNALFDESVLHAAARAGHNELVRALLEAGADATAQDSRGRTPLHTAAAHGHQGTSQLLLDEGVPAELAKSSDLRDKWRTSLASAKAPHFELPGLRRDYPELPKKIYPLTAATAADLAALNGHGWLAEQISVSCADPYERVMLTHNAKVAATRAALRTAEEGSQGSLDSHNLGVQAAATEQQVWARQIEAAATELLGASSAETTLRNEARELLLRERERGNQLLAAAAAKEKARRAVEAIANERASTASKLLAKEIQMRESTEMLRGFEQRRLTQRTRQELKRSRKLQRELHRGRSAADDED